jgi:hypothetical protein
MQSVFATILQFCVFLEKVHMGAKFYHGERRCDKPGTCVAMREHKMTMSIITKHQ